MLNLLLVFFPLQVTVEETFSYYRLAIFGALFAAVPLKHLLCGAKLCQKFH